MDAVNSVIRTREDLKFLTGTHVVCSGRIKEFRKHDTRKDLDSVLLVNVYITPVPAGESIYISHLFVLKKELRTIGCIPEQNKRIWFEGRVYPYKRLGGKSVDRGLYNTKDYGVKPLQLIPEVRQFLHEN